jgi:hypothetical protein
MIPSGASHQRRQPLLRLVGGLILWLVLLFLPRELGAAEGFSVYQVQAAYLCNFTKHIEWPPDAFASGEAPIAIGVLGDDPFGGLLDRAVAGRSSQGRKLVVRRARDLNPLLNCQVIFISRSERGQLPAILAALRNRPILTVCNDDAVFEQGVMVKFLLVNETVRFEVKLGPAKRAGIKLGSDILGAAKRVSR